MNKAFKFPPDAPPPPAVPTVTVSDESNQDITPISPGNIPSNSVTPAELPPPTPTKKDDANGRAEFANDPDEDVGETVEVDLS